MQMRITKYNSTNESHSIMNNLLVSIQLETILFVQKFQLHGSNYDECDYLQQSLSLGSYMVGKFRPRIIFAMQTLIGIKDS